MDSFYRELDKKEQEDRIARIVKNRPADLHDYQGCANDEANMSKHDKHKFRRSGFNGLCNFLNTAGEYCREEEGHSCHIPSKTELLVCGCVGNCVGHNITSPIKPKFPIGSAVCHRAFVDCFKKQHDAVPGLTVIESKLIAPDSIPAYYRIKAVGPNGRGYVEAAERFFDAE